MRLNNLKLKYYSATKKYIQKNYLNKHHRPPLLISTKVLNLSKVALNNNKVGVLKLGLVL